MVTLRDESNIFRKVTNLERNFDRTRNRRLTGADIQTPNAYIQAPKCLHTSAKNANINDEAPNAYIQAPNADASTPAVLPPYSRRTPAAGPKEDMDVYPPDPRTTKREPFARRAFGKKEKKRRRPQTLIAGGGG